MRTRASSGSSTICRSPRPTRSTARRCTRSRSNGWERQRPDLPHLQPDRVDDRLPARVLLGHVASARIGAEIAGGLETGSRAAFSRRVRRRRPVWWHRRCDRARGSACRRARKCRETTRPTMSGTPCSIAVGMSGARLQALLGVDRERRESCRCCASSGSGPMMFGDIIGMWPLTRSAMPGPAPL